jgi:ribosome maturation factor RimP
MEGQMTLQGKLGEVVEGKVEVKLDKNRNILVPFEAVKAARLVVEI